MTPTDPVGLAPGDRIVVNGHTYHVTGTPERDVHGRVWVDVDLGGLALPVVYAPDADVEIERLAGVSA